MIVVHWYLKFIYELKIAEFLELLFNDRFDFYIYSKNIGVSDLSDIIYMGDCVIATLIKV